MTQSLISWRRLSLLMQLPDGLWCMPLAQIVLWALPTYWCSRFACKWVFSASTWALASLWLFWWGCRFHLKWASLLSLQFGCVSQCAYLCVPNCIPICKFIAAFWAAAYVWFVPPVYLSVSVSDWLTDQIDRVVPDYRMWVTSQHPLVILLKSTA